MCTQQFVCLECNKTVGCRSVFSTFAWYAQNWAEDLHALKEGEKKIGLSKHTYKI